MMKKSILVFSMTSLLLIGGMNMAIAQEQPKPKKDTVNMDTDAKPKFYYPVEDEKSGAKGSSDKGSSSTILIIAGAVVLAAAAGFFLLKKKK
jgi:LPXTG-motif cell wall-anchored protein